MKKLLLLLFFCLPAFAQESCTLSSDGTTLSVSDCSPALDAAPFTAQVTFTPTYSYADNRYCGKGNVAKFGANDGPATLPQACFYTALDGTPSPGAATKVGAGSLQTALAAAQCGDTLLLDHTQTFSGPYSFPAKNCDDAHWITVRTDSPDSALPYEGKRIDPSFSSVLAKIALRPNSSPNTFGDHYRFVGIEWKKQPGGILNAFANMSGSSKIVFERNYFHGNPGEELAHGVQENNATYIAVIDSYFADFHCIAVTGSCTDSQAISGGNGTGNMGPFKAVNNYLEAAAENILYGGAPGTAVPYDIEIRRNDLVKPLAWLPAVSSVKYIVKNHFELKNAGRVLFEDNQMANLWGGFSQVGRSLVLTAKNQGNPNAQVHDVTIRNAKITHSCGVIAVAFIAADSGAWANSEYNISIHDVTADNLGASDLSGCANFLDEVMTAPGIAAPLQPLHDVSLANITETLASNHLPVSWLTLGGSTTLKMFNFAWTNSSLNAGKYGVWSSGGLSNCATAPPTPKGKFDACFANYQFSGNTVLGATGLWP